MSRRRLPLHLPAILILAGLVSACAPVRETPPPVPLYEAVAAGDRLVVERAASVGEVGRTLYFRQGGARSWIGFGAWDTLCRVRLSDDLAGRQLVPGEQTVSKVTHGHDMLTAEMANVYVEVALAPPGPMESLRCERSIDLSGETYPPLPISVDDFQRAVGGYLRFEH